MERFLIIVAGGRGQRMRSDKPKQFLKIGKYPIVYHSMKKFYEYDNDLKIILVLPHHLMAEWESFIAGSGIILPHQLTKGGNTRMDSCRNGLSLIGDEGLVAIHDGVRPLVSYETIDRCFKMAEERGNAVPVCDIYETLRQISSDGSITIDRNLVKSVQTPQIFHVKVLKDAFLHYQADQFTDEASMVESLGYSINMVQGNRENIKITDLYDLKIAEFLLDSNQSLS
jgi:2-C-methyl-D-erythritol 4-phosphate cytidylyltransferase